MLWDGRVILLPHTIDLLLIPSAHPRCVHLYASSSLSQGAARKSDGFDFCGHQPTLAKPRACNTTNYSREGSLPNHILLCPLSRSLHMDTTFKKIYRCNIQKSTFPEIPSTRYLVFQQ